MKIDVELVRQIHDLLVSSENGSLLDTDDVRSVRIKLESLLAVERSGYLLECDRYELDVDAFAELDYVDHTHAQWSWFRDSAEDGMYSQYPKPVRCLNVSIGGELWDFMLTVIDTKLAQDYSCYGQWCICGISITEKVRK